MNLLTRRCGRGGNHDAALHLLGLRLLGLRLLWLRLWLALLGRRGLTGPARTVGTFVVGRRHFAAALGTDPREHDFLLLIYR